MGVGILDNKKFSVTVTGKSKTGEYEVSFGTVFSSFDEACKGAGEMIKQIDKRCHPEGKSASVDNGKKAQEPDSNELKTKEFLIHSARLGYSDSGQPHLRIKLQPGLMKHGVYCWPEVFEQFYGSVDSLSSTYGIGIEIPTPKEISKAVVAYKGKSANKVIALK